MKKEGVEIASQFSIASQVKIRVNLRRASGSLLFFNIKPIYIILQIYLMSRGKQKNLSTSEPI